MTASNTVMGTKTWMGTHPKNQRPVIVIEGPEGAGREVVFADTPQRPSVKDAAEIWSEQETKYWQDSSPGGPKDPWKCRSPKAVRPNENWRARQP